VSFSGRDSLTFTLIRAIIETGIDRFLLRYNFCDDKFSLHDLPLLFPCAKLYRIIIHFKCKHFLSNLIVVNYFSVNKLFKYRLILVSLTQFNNLFRSHM
jgi:hypothetical protein